jgi:hypothetical protein
MSESRVPEAVRSLITGSILLFAIMNVAVAETNTPPRTAPQLEQLVAPIALYPDSLLSQVLMASTYPLEVVAAARWSQANPGVTGAALEEAMQKQPWDPSVKALTAVPQTLQMMNDKLEWTQALGDAFLAQQADVLDAVQRLRQRADTAGHLETTAQQKVTKTAAPAGTAPQGSAAPAYVYTIESVNPDECYVPIYDPGVVYGAWPYPDYQPFYWYPRGYVGSNVFAFAAGVAVGAAIWGAIDWGRRRVDIDVNRYNRFNRTNVTNRNWTHNPAHRGAVPYRDANVAQRFGKPGESAAREAFRGKADAGRRELAQPGSGNIGPKPSVQPRQGGAADRVAGNKPGADRQARPKQSAQPRQAHPKQTVKPNQGGGNRHVAQQRSQPAPKRHGATPSRGHAGRGHAHAPRAAGGGGRGGRRSDIRLKHDIVLLGYLDNGLGFYRFIYNGGDQAYVGVMAQEVHKIVPAAVLRGPDGYLRVLYDRLGLEFQTYEQWIESGARLPATAQTRR